MEIIVGKKTFRFGIKPESEMTPEEVKLFIDKEVQAFKKSFTYDKLFTTGMMMSQITGGGSVSNPYATVASVYKSIKAIADNVPQADPQIYDANRAKVNDKSLMTLIKKPNPRQNFVDFLQEWTGFYALNGEAFILKTKSFGQAIGTGYNLPAELINLNPADMQEIIDQNTQNLVAWKNTKTQQEYAPEDIIHKKDFNPYNKWRGLKPIQPILDEMQIDQATLEFNLAFFKNDATPGFALATDQTLSEDQLKQIEAWWDKRHKGHRNAFKFAVFQRGLKPTSITPTHKDMDFVSQKDLTRKEILGIWRVPEGLFNMTKDINYATLMGQMLIFWIYTLTPVLNKFSSAMTDNIVVPYNPALQFDFDLSNVPAFQEQLSAKADVGIKFFNMGFTTNEINKRLEYGFEESELRDISYVPAGYIPAGESQQADPEDPQVNPDDKTKAPRGINNKMRRALLVKNFDRRQTHVERLFASKISRYFNELRVEALKTPQVMLEKGIVNVDWHKADDKIRKFITPIMWLAIQSGASMGKDTVASQKGIEDDKIQQSLQSYLSVKMDGIADLNDTVKDQLSQTLKDAISSGTSHGQTRDELLGILTEEMKGVFNRAVTRAALIARTETVGAVNGGSLLYYDSIGVTKKSWITAHDGEVRESHRQAEDQGEISINRTFNNGLDYPGDPNGDASEICNCRCVLAPSMGD